MMAITNIVNGHHSFVVLPTGFGKSDIFFLVPLIMDVIDNTRKHFSIVFIPLLSLMSDMTFKFRERGVKVVMVTEAGKMDQKDITGISNGEFSVILVSPEILQVTNRWINVFVKSAIYSASVSIVAIDEAHVLIEWYVSFNITVS